MNHLPILKDHHDDYPKRIRDLDHLHTIAESYPGLTEFLADLALAPPDGSAVGVEPTGRDDEQVVLSTIHSAKGLEWQCVFSVGRGWEVSLGIFVQIPTRSWRRNGDCCMSP